ncbi:hypothetical protein Q8A73_018805 [Channa argus]|nr:hypothetical protein Q8A73_018805 [Channa argus]
MVRRASAMFGNLTDQLDRSSMAKLMVFIRMAFDDFSTKEELLTLLPLKTTTRGVEIYNTVEKFLVEKKVLLEKLASALCAKVIGFEHVMTPVVKITNSIRSRAKQHRTFKRVLKNNASAYEAFDKAAEKYSQVIKRLGQEFENSFCDLDQLDPCVCRSLLILS